MYLDCLHEALAQVGISGDQATEIIALYETCLTSAQHSGQSPVMAAAEAAAKLQALVEERAQRKAARAAKTVQVVAEFQQRLAAARTSDATISRWVLDRGEKAGGVRLARAAISLLEADPRFPGVGLVEHREAMRGLLFSKLGDALNTVRKGAWGRQVGKAHLPNIVRELFGGQTGDKAAGVFARGYEAAIDHYRAPCKIACLAG